MDNRERLEQAIFLIRYVKNDMKDGWAPLQDIDDQLMAFMRNQDND